MSTAEPAARPRPWMYVWWLVVGALFGFGVAALLSIGFVFLVVALALAVFGASREALRNRSVAAVLAGLAVAPMYIAWLNRDGPGEVCTTTATETSCIDAWSPWPFVAVSLLLVAAAVALVVGISRGIGPNTSTE